jgi:hypothetical protein
MLALLMIVGAFVYDLIFAGLPYPDPTPAMAARYALHSQIASIGYMVGLLVLLATIVIRVTRLWRQR